MSLHVALICDLCSFRFALDESSEANVRRVARERGWTERDDAFADLCPSCVEKSTLPFRDET